MENGIENNGKEGISEIELSITKGANCKMSLNMVIIEFLFFLIS